MPESSVSETMGRAEEHHTREIEEHPLHADSDIAVVLSAVADTRRERRNQARAVLALLAVATILLAVPGLVAYQLAKGQVELYEAETDVLHRIERAEFGESETIMANAKVLAEGRDLLGDLTPSEDLTMETILERRSVDVVEERVASSSVLRLSVRNPDPATAIDEVDQWATAYQEAASVVDPDAARRAELESIIEELQARRVEAQLGIDEAEQARAEANLSGLSTTRRAQVVGELDQAVNAAGSRYAETVRDLDTQARLLEQLEPEGVRVETTRLGLTSVSEDPVSPQPVRDLALGLAVGMVLAAAFLFVAFQLRSR